MKAEEILRNLVKFNTIKDKENNQILDYIKSILKPLGFNTQYKDIMLKLIS